MQLPSLAVLIHTTALVRVTHPALMTVRRFGVRLAPLRGALAPVIPALAPIRLGVRVLRVLQATPALIAALPTAALIPVLLPARIVVEDLVVVILVVEALRAIGEMGALFVTLLVGVILWIWIQKTKSLQ